MADSDSEEDTRPKRGNEEDTRPKRGKKRQIASDTESEDEEFKAVLQRSMVEVGGPGLVTPNAAATPAGRTPGAASSSSSSFRLRQLDQDVKEEEEDELRRLESGA